MPNKTIDVKELVDWIYKQPKDKKVQMVENRFDDACGCIMVQYGREQGLEFHECTNAFWIARSGDVRAKLMDRQKPVSVFSLITPDSTGFGIASFQGTFAKLITRLQPKYQRQ